MIWSVSTLLRRSGTARPGVDGERLHVSSASRRTPAAVTGGRSAGDGRRAGHGGGGGDQRRDQVGAAALALPALEVAVGRRRAALPRGQLVGVHAQAHRAAGVPPLGAGLLEDLVETLGLGREPDPHRAGDDEHPHARRRPAARAAPRRRRAGPRSGRWCTSRGTRCRPRSRAAACPAVRPMYSSARSAAARSCSSAYDAGSGTDAGQRQPLPGVGAPGDERRERAPRR